MQIIISPAKKMKVDVDSFAPGGAADFPRGDRAAEDDPSRG